MSRAMCPRELARENARLGVAYLGRALNACDNPDIPYKYSQAAIDEFMRIGSELVRLIDEGKIVERKGAVAQADFCFQRFLSTATGPRSSD